MCEGFLLLLPPVGRWPAVVLFPLILTGTFLAVTAAREWKDDAGF